MLLVDLMRFAGLLFVSHGTLLAENLFLRRQLALYKERGIKPRRVDAATRVSLAVLSRLFDWRNALVVVRPETLVRWHRAGWRLFWRYKCCTGRPPIPLELRQLIRRMAKDNSLDVVKLRKSQNISLLDAYGELLRTAIGCFTRIG